MPLVYDPGTRWNYGINTDVVGLAVEAVTGQRLHHYIRDHICKPLGMTSTTFVLDDAQRARMTRVHARQPDVGVPGMDEVGPGGAEQLPFGPVQHLAQRPVHLDELALG